MMIVIENTFKLVCLFLLQVGPFYILVKRSQSPEFLACKNVFVHPALLLV